MPGQLLPGRYCTECGSRRAIAPFALVFRLEKHKGRSSPILPSSDLRPFKVAARLLSPTLGQARVEFRPGGRRQFLIGRYSALASERNFLNLGDPYTVMGTIVDFGGGALSVTRDPLRDLDRAPGIHIGRQSGSAKGMTSDPLFYPNGSGSRLNQPPNIDSGHRSGCDQFPIL